MSEDITVSSWRTEHPVFRWHAEASDDENSRWFAAITRRGAERGAVRSVKRARLEYSEKRTRTIGGER